MRDRTLNSILGYPHTPENPLFSLMPRRVYNLLIVASLYDSFTIMEEGRLAEVLVSDYLSLNLRFPPRIERVSTAEEALKRLKKVSFDLVISMPRVGKMDLREFGLALKKISPDLTLVLLAGSAKELGRFQSISKDPCIDRVFLWQGDVRLFLAIIKLIEDRNNAWHDARIAGIKSIILIEDSPLFYSSYLPILYTEVVNQTQALMADGVNRMQKMMRMRARPRILLGTTFEEGLELYERYRDHILGFILDASFPRMGKLDHNAGIDFLHLVREESPDIPILVQSGSSDKAREIETYGVKFIDKHSHNLLAEVKTFMREDLGFGDFIFRMPDGTEIARAHDLVSLSTAIEKVPDECLMYHAGRDDFSMWFMARTEFDMAAALRPRKAEDFEGPQAIRSLLLKALRFTREQSRAGVVAEFSPDTFEGGEGFVKIGGGSLGGKGRGLAFINSLFNTYSVEDHFPGIRISIPFTAVVATDVYDRFLEKHDLLRKAIEEENDGVITRDFLQSRLPDEVTNQLRIFLERVRFPLAVRSSSLLEDASYQPFAGIYQTYMIPNNNEDIEVRLRELSCAIRMVYASTFHSNAKAYIEATPNRLEEEKMAVVIQQVVGRRFDGYFYPNFAGVARSVNFYPIGGTKPEEGIVSVALGLGNTVVEGGRCVRFCPAHPRKPIQSFSTEEYLENSQRTFFAMDLKLPGPRGKVSDFDRFGSVSLDLSVAEKHGTLSPVGSVFSPDNNAIYDGVSRRGARLVTMAGVLKGKIFPLGEVLALLLKIGAAASSCTVEMEFAVKLSDDPAKPHEFGFLQIRPLVFGSSVEEIQLEGVDRDRAICVAHSALGNGFRGDISDLVYVRRDTFDRSKTALIAMEVGELNLKLKKRRQPFVLIGPGRWGSADPWLGIPVQWSQISGAQSIIETDLEDIHVEPSQGSHFFQNIVSLGVAFLSPNLKKAQDVLDWDWLDSQPAREETEHLRHLSFDKPMEIILNGKKSFGVVMKPGQGRNMLRQ